jgi:tetratricopeptide (TPR) repeat protein
LYQFAQRLLQEKAYAQAREAFHALTLSPSLSLSLIPSFLNGFARSSEELGLLSEALPAYQRIIAEYPLTEQSAQALFRIGVIQFDRLRDLDSAITAFRLVKQSPRAGALASEASVRIAEAFIAKNDLKNARAECLSLVRSPLPNYQDVASLRLAELDFYEGQFDTALLRLDRFTANTLTDIANDALPLQYFIRENLGTAAALGAFARADLFMRQQKYSESLLLFHNVARQNPNALLLDDTYMHIGELNVLLGRPDSARAAFRFVADSIELSIWKDRAQFRIAEIAETITHDRIAAIEAYELLLERFPNSLYAASARQRIRELRKAPGMNTTD